MQFSGEYRPKASSYLSQQLYVVFSTLIQTEDNVLLPQSLDYIMRYETTQTKQVTTRPHLQMDTNFTANLSRHILGDGCPSNMPEQIKILQ